MSGNYVTKFIFAVSFLGLAACASASKFNREYSAAQDLATSNSSEKSIVKGTEVEPGDAEENTAIMLLITRESRLHVCTAVLVAPKVLLTAAHCVAGVEPKKIRVAFPAQKDLRPKRIVVHEKFNGSPEGKWDLALVSLPEKPPKGFDPIPLLSAKDKVSEDDVLLVGYGITGETKSDSMVLRKTSKSLAADINLKEGFFGIDQTNSTGGFCRGDSGAPVIVISGGKQKLLGINSFTIGVEQNRECHTASVAMHVPQFKTWIEDRAKKM